MSSQLGKAFCFSSASRLHGFDKPTVWHEFTGLAQTMNAVNLGQGFPDFAPPAFLTNALTDAAGPKNLNMYARSAGLMSLANEIAKKYSKEYGRMIDPLHEVLTTVGSTEGLFCAAMGLLEPGDEVVVFEPAFDIYLADVQMADAKIVGVPLTVVNGKWVFDKEAFKRAFTDKTRLFFINSPHNPTGKVYTKDEYEFIASVLLNFPNCNVVADEVYEKLVYEEKEHFSIAKLPGMFERTLVLGSAGKTWSVTGWKIGWMCGPAHLVRPCALVHQWTVFSISTPMQDAVAAAITLSEHVQDNGKNYYENLLASYSNRRSKLMAALSDCGLVPICPEGSFFIMADTSAIKIPSHYLVDTSRDYAFCRFLTKEIGVAAIPPSAFMSETNKTLMQNYARFAFCKSDEVMSEAIKRLTKLNSFR